MTAPNEKEALQLLVVGDVHAELSALGCVVASAKASGEAYDVALCPGDLGSDAPYTAREADASLTERLHSLSIPPILETLGALEVPVLFVPGNHDRRDLNGNGIVRSVDLLGGHSSVQIKGWRIAGIGGSPLTPAQLPYEWDDNSMRDCAAEVFGTTPPDILLLHSPPRADRCDVGGPAREHLGSVWLRRMIDEIAPRLVICGHVHEAFGFELIGQTVLVNAGKIHDDRTLWMDDGRGMWAKVYSYFSIVLSVDGRMTIANFMHAPGFGITIAPIVASHDGGQLRSRTMPRETARRAWATPRMDVP